MKEMQPVAEQMYPLLEWKMFLIIKPQARQRQLGAYGHYTEIK